VAGGTETCTHCASPLRPNAPFCATCGHAVTGRLIRAPRPGGASAPTYQAPAAIAPQPQQTVAADARLRAGAFLLDLAIMASPVLPLAGIAAILHVADVVVVVAPVAGVAVWAWMLVWQSMTGMTFGKAMLGLRCVSIAGCRAPGVGSSFVRSLVFLGTCGLAGLPLLSGHPGTQDRLSDTGVLDVVTGRNPLGPVQRPPLRAPANRGLLAVQSPVPVPSSRPGGRI
jgi:hypothetical protein